MGIGYIYLITNLINNKKYIGQTSNTIEYRWQQHCSHANDPKKALGIDGAIAKYGPENFKIEKIKECPIEELDKWEIYYIKKYQTYQGDNLEKGYNLTLGGKGGLRFEINEQEMLAMFYQGKTAKEISQHYGCSDKTIGKRLKKYGADLEKNRIEWLKKHSKDNKGCFKKGQPSNEYSFQKDDNIKPVKIIELNKEFKSLKECSQWLLDNGYSKAKNWEIVRKSLSRHLNGERETYLKMHFEFI